jgi:hypothetical protein
MADPRYDSTRNQYVAGNDPAADTPYLANGAIAITDGVHAIAKTSIAAMTLAQPTAAQEGIKVVLTARTAFAHVVTVTGGAGFTTITFAAVGDSVELLADNLKWCPTGAAFRAVIA